MNWFQGVLALTFLILGFALILAAVFFIGARDTTLSGTLIILAMFLLILAVLFLLWRPSEISLGSGYP